MLELIEQDVKAFSLLGEWMMEEWKRSSLLVLVFVVVMMVVARNDCYLSLFSMHSLMKMMQSMSNW